MTKRDTQRPTERSYRHKTYLLVALVLLVPIVPFLIVGGWFEPKAEQWVQATASKPLVASLIILLLGSDILLPVPSSVISMLAGRHLGASLGTLCSWLGMTTSALVGFAMARYAGARLWSGRDPTMAAEGLQNQLGSWGLVVARGLPVLAEATVLYAGLRRMSWRRFLPPVLLSNLGISAAYAWLGDRAKSPELLAIALGVAAAAPLLLATLLRRSHATGGRQES